ncbi:putative photosynthetic complex assembly protein PuhE [Sphingomicrobium sediminis]|uniref:Photosynthetic complex assembly protein PuhE n=1 Tax=Sphingomicrobium sediminis TaxID=2950949 RepID=A0A9X2EEI6_9SPHN|nr:putative photosynthetic complex assembly protein PuhE [Sphingomicrobium sediminis]MCM8556500.1 putative photosynthetic complex assembly protein PuhE [Sphingomicrobium sediminis]
MVSWTGHILPVVVTVAVWFFATGLIAWLDGRERATFPRSLFVSGAIGIAGLVAILISAHTVSASAIYLSFAGALMVWSWHEVAFLTGAVSGPNRGPCPADARGLDRFAHASATLLHHELALALTAVLLLFLTWGAANQVGAMVFLLLFVLRLSAKMNIFVGVPNSSTELLPPHLDYLKTYFGPNRLTWLLPVSLIAILALAGWIGSEALASAPGSPAMIGASLLFALTLLGALEHLFLALPFRDGMLWGWALRRRGPPSTSDLTTRGS